MNNTTRHVAVRIFMSKQHGFKDFRSKLITSRGAITPLPDHLIPLDTMAREMGNHLLSNLLAQDFVQGISFIVNNKNMRQFGAYFLMN